MPYWQAASVPCIRCLTACDPRCHAPAFRAWLFLVAVRRHSSKRMMMRRTVCWAGSDWRMTVHGTPRTRRARLSVSFLACFGLNSKRCASFLPPGTPAAARASWSCGTVVFAGNVVVRSRPGHPVGRWCLAGLAVSGPGLEGLLRHGMCMSADRLFMPLHLFFFVASMRLCLFFSCSPDRV